MSLTQSVNRSDSPIRKPGLIAAVIALHLGALYVLTHSMNVINLVKPLKDPVAVFIPDEKPPEPPPPVAKPDPVQLDTMTPTIPEPVVTEVPVEVAVEPQPSDAIAAAPSTPANAPAARSFSIAKRVDPTYPPASRRAGEAGTVVLDIVVGKDGVPVEVNLITSSGFSALDNAAITAVRKWRFTVNSDSAYSKIRLPVTFKLEQ